MTTIYLDHSATTPLDPRVLEAMRPYFSEQYGNSMAIHGLGRAAEHAIENARAAVARSLSCAPHEVIFTSGGTESDNLGLRGPAQYARANHRPFTLITGPVEHHAISVTARQLRTTLGARLRIVPVDYYGRVDPDALAATLQNLPDDGITLVSLIHTNNELGTRNPIADLAQVAHAHGALFHTDAVQSAGHVPLDVSALGVDMLSLSAHKFYGPKGMGVFYLRDDTPFLSSHSGARHEEGHRAGTHNTPGIVGTAAALEIACEEMDARCAHLRTLRDRLIEGVLAAAPDIELTGHATDRLPGHASFVIKGVESSTLLMQLDQRGIAASAGSACKVGNPQPSPILMALGYGPEWTRGGLRLTLGQHNTPDEIEYTIDTLADVVPVVRKLAAMSVAPSLD